MIEEIEASSHAPVTDIVVNSHLIEETAGPVIEEGIKLAEDVAEATGRRVAFVVVERRLLATFDAGSSRYPVMVLDRLMLKPWEQSNWLGKYRINI